jgi:S-adenosylmethionine hydrolase
MITVPLRDTYGDVAPGQLVALWSSWDTIEIAVRDGSAAARLGVDRGATVTVIGG